MGILDTITNTVSKIKQTVVNASYYSAEKSANLFGLTPIKQTDTAKEIATKSVKNIISEATTLVAGRLVSKVPITAKTVTAGAVIGTAGAGYIVASNNPLETTKSLVSNVGTLVPKTSSAVFDLGATLKESKDTLSINPIVEYGKEHPIFSGAILASTAYLGGKSISSGINLLTAEKLDTKIDKATDKISEGFTPTSSTLVGYNPNQEDIEEEITKREIKLAEISAKTREKELETQTKLREKELDTQQYLAKQTAQQSNISTPTPQTVVPTTTKKSTTKKKTTKKKATKKKPKTKKKSKKSSKSKNKR